LLSYQKIQAVSRHLARILREERQKQGLSMNAVAERSGLSAPMVGYVEREMRAPTVETVLRMAHALDLDAADLIRRAQKAASA
jgi:transcriptional regulator with XRE-family HTH domain